MTREYRDNIWMSTNKDGTVSVGLTQNFIETKLSECFHIMQADASMVKKDGPMLVIETNDGLSSLKSPLTGRIVHFNDRARNFPDKLKEDDTIMILLPNVIKGPKQENVKPVKVVDPVEDLFAALPVDWNAWPEPVNPMPLAPVVNNNQRRQREALDALANRPRRAR